jgi:hypothetical protein
MHTAALVPWALPTAHAKLVSSKSTSHNVTLWRAVVLRAAPVILTSTSAQAIRARTMQRVLIVLSLGRTGAPALPVMPTRCAAMISTTGKYRADRHKCTTGLLLEIARWTLTSATAIPVPMEQDVSRRTFHRTPACAQQVTRAPIARQI